MKKTLWVFFCLFLIISMSGQVQATKETTKKETAKEIKKVAILPFSVHSSENIDYVQAGIWDMLFSRIAVSGKIDVVSKDSTLKALKEAGKKDLAQSDVYALGKKMNVDFIVWGSITKIGNSVSLDGKLVDIASYKSSVGVFAQCKGMDEVIPKIADFAKRIDYHILGLVPSTFGLPPAPSAMPQQPAGQYPRETEIITRMKGGRGTFTSAINPDFINAARPMKRRGFWMTKRYPTEFKGMDIGDVNNDGLNEVVVIDDHNVMIYQKKEKSFKLLQKIAGKPYDNYLAVDVADINNNGIPEIIVTSIRRNLLNSFVLEFKDEKFQKTASNLRWFMRVIDTTGSPLLLGQKIAIDEPFSNPIYNIVWRGGEYREGKKMKIPEGLSVYGLTIDNLGISKKERIIALNEYDHICIFEKTDKPLSKISVMSGSDEFLWKSDDVFGGSNNCFELSEQQQVADDTNEKDVTFIKVRILTYDINKDGRKEIIVVKNLSSVGRIFKNLKVFTSSEIYDLEWDGLGLLENWRTRKINGYVADYQFKDIDNDGQNEIVLALNMTIGGMKTRKSVIVAYDLNIQSE
ncbi:MAG: VCBS repeat-containing protein [Thermodesulfobacteriota bacterium]|nr:VCBS repeat-containing protein [Thermodesulfobacteriota bacterium]